MKINLNFQINDRDQQHLQYKFIEIQTVIEYLLIKNFHLKYIYINQIVLE